MKDYLNQMSILEKSCYDAGRIALEFRKKMNFIKTEVARDVVTEADFAINRLLRECLLQKNPSYGWISEESPYNWNRQHQGRFYIVDPIDGTKSFVEGSSDYAISVALVEEGLPIAAAVYNPSMNHMIVAARGGGVHFNGVLHPKEDQNNHCLVSANDEKKGFFDVLKNHVTLIPMHSIAYKLALVGIGKSEWTLSCTTKHHWDVAAGHLICEENGCVVTDFLQNKISYKISDPKIKGIIAAPRNFSLKFLKKNMDFFKNGNK